MQTVEAIKTMPGTAKRRSAWLVVAVSSVGLFLHFGSLLVNAFGVMLTTLCDQFHWSRTEVSLAFTLATLTAMLTMPLTGWLTDRLGSRRPILISMLVFGIQAVLRARSLNSPSAKEAPFELLPAEGGLRT